MEVIQAYQVLDDFVRRPFLFPDVTYLMFISGESLPSVYISMVKITSHLRMTNM